MAYQGMIQAVEGHALKVVFPFGGTVHEVHLPPLFNAQHPLWFPHRPGSVEASTRLREEAATVLQCLTARAALEQQRALAAAGALGSLCIDLPPFLSELHGSFAALAQQLQDCVHRRRQARYVSPSPVALLIQAARQGHLAAAQQLLLIDPGAARGDLRDELETLYTYVQPVMYAASSSAAVLRLLLAAAPAAVDDTGFHMVQDQLGWTAMHSAAWSNNVEAMRLLLQLAPHLASASTDAGITPLRMAAEYGGSEAVRLLLEAAPETAASADGRPWLPMHQAATYANTDALRALIDAGAPGLDVPAEDGSLPLHLAADQDNDAAVRLLLAAHPAAALVKDSEGRLPLQVALRWGRIPACRALLFASGLGAAQLLDAFAAVPARAQPRAQPLFADLAAHYALTAEQWQRVPAPCPGLGSALPAVLARSEAEAALLAAHLPPADAERLQVAALSLHRAQHALQLEAPVPAALVRRILALALSDE